MNEENPFAGQGAVMLDIGGDVGALVVEMPAELVGVEVEIRPAGSVTDHVHDHVHDHDRDHAHHPHVAVVARPAGNTVVPSLVFPELTEGDYELYVKPDGEVRITARVTGGAVAHATWPA
ncbi:MAG TPA: hypothetical protein VFD59_21180 [Nocardioidaceae bacterium]|nr:hypothetical protein [Nocardioidaceae bacterium]